MKYIRFDKKNSKNENMYQRLQIPTFLNCEQNAKSYFVSEKIVRLLGHTLITYGIDEGIFVINHYDFVT